MLASTDVMPLSSFLAIWILMLLLKLTVTANSKQNISFLNLQEKRLIYDCSKSVWKYKSLHKNDSIETVKLTPLNTTLRFENSQVIEDAIFRKEYKDRMKNINESTLMDYNGPMIIEDLDNRSDQKSNYVRVKRNEPKNESIIHHSSININHSYNLSGNIVNTSHPRYKRGLLSMSGHRRKRVKGNIRHSKHVGNKIRSKKHGAKKTFRKRMKKTNGSGVKNKKIKINRSVRAIDFESQMKSNIKKRESKNNNLNTDTDTVFTVTSKNYEKADLINKDIPLLINSKNSDMQQQKNTIILPFIHTEKAQLQVRIEKIPTNESLFIKQDICRDHSSDPYPTILPKYTITDGIININVVNPEIASNFDSNRKQKANNSTAEITLKKLYYESNISNWKTNDSKNALSHNAELHSLKSDLQEINDGNNDKTNKISAESLNEDIKSRAKRNQIITSKLNSMNTMGLKDFKHIKERASITAINENTRYKKTHDNRAMRSIEEIKQLTEKLITKVNELRAYTNDSAFHDKGTKKKIEALYVTGSCTGKNANRVGIEETPRISSVNLNSKSNVIENIDKRQQFAKNSEGMDSVGRRSCQTSFNVLRPAREGYRRRKSRRKWGRWIDWSSCSVTCGKGRQIRWRHCLHDCDDAETEMEEKACQLPACPPGKFLGIF